MIDRAALERSCHGALCDRDEPGSSGRDAVACLGTWMIDPARGIEHFERVLAHQTDEGILPANGDRGVALPLHGTALRLLYYATRKHVPDLADRLEALVPRVERFHQALDRRSAAHLSPTDPEDEQVAPVPPVEQPLVGVGRNAIMVQAESDLADVAIPSGHEAQEIMVRRTHRAQALARRLWREEAGCFCARRNREWADPVVADGLLALYCGCARPGQARVIAARHLTTHGFWSPHPLAQGSVPELRVVSPLLNWLMITGLYRYGLDDLAQELREETLRLAAGWGLWTSFQADAGGGQGREQDPITAAIVLQLLSLPVGQQQLSHF